MMKSLVLFLLLFTLLLISVSAKRSQKAFKSQTNGNFSIGDNIWPFPQSLAIAETFVSIDPKNFKFISHTKGKCDLLDKAIIRYKRLLFLEDCSLVSDSEYQTLFATKRHLEQDVNFRGNLTSIDVYVIEKCDSEPHLDMNEKYTIEVNEERGIISADTVWGAIRALETMSQLMENVGQNQFILNISMISDFPRFKHRGLLLDTSRHFIPINRLEQSLDAMSYNKFNVFHWHMTDDQSFPYVSHVFPNLSLKGAYNPKTHVYTNEDMQHIIEYAKERGIRVLVEFDTPGHTLAWGKGQSDLLTECHTGDKPNGMYGPIDPSKPSTYEFIEKLFKEIVNRFPDQYIHLGGDEVDYNCWRSNPSIIEFMKMKKFIKNTKSNTKKTNEPFVKLEEYYIQKVIDIVKALNKSSIVWQEVFDNRAQLDPDTVVHVWKFDNWVNEMSNVTKSGYKALLSSCWYLNKISYGTDWHKYYTCDPLGFKGTDQQNQLVIGGEACVWGEWVDASNIIGRTWPRAISVAERLWSSRELRNAFSANRRFDRQHCIMQRRGLRVEPSNGVGYCQCDHLL